MRRRDKEMTNTRMIIELTKSQNITNIREKLGITRKEFSDALGLSVEEEKELKYWESDKKEVPDEIYKKILAFPTEPPFVAPSLENSRFTQIDLFAGIGGIRLGFQRHGGRTVFSSEWDKFAQKTYRINYGEMPAGDITEIDEKDIPKHDILLAGFPCQPFSQAGLKKGFEDARGTLFFNIAKILREKRPKAFMLENVKQLRGHDKGRTIEVILKEQADPLSKEGVIGTFCRTYSVSTAIDTFLKDIPQLDNAAKTDNGDNRKLVLAGDFVINSRSDRRGACGISPFDGSVSVINTVLSPQLSVSNGY